MIPLPAHPLHGVRTGPLLGRKVATLVDGTRTVGTYTVAWDASDLASGTYVYRLEAGSTVLARKMTLLR